MVQTESARIADSLDSAERGAAVSIETVKPPHPSRVLSLLAFAIYMAASMLFYGRGILSALGTKYIGQGSDPAYYLWCMSWWLYAPAHHLNPFYTYLLWAPEGFNVAWSTSIPLLSYAAAPITLWRGPVVAFNLLNLILPALSGWSAFILIRRCIGGEGPALVGGYLYGFSPFMIASQAAGHIVFTAAFLIPLAINLALAHLDDRVRKYKFIGMLTIILVCEFLISIEFFATLLMFGTIAIGAAAFFFPGRRARLTSAAKAAGMALVITVVALSPYFFFMLRASGLGLHPVWSGSASSDLLEFIIPTRVMLVGLCPALREIASHYVYDSYIWDSGAYASLPILIVSASYLWSYRHEGVGKFLALSIVIVAVTMLGTHLHIAGHNLSKLPWFIVGKLPFINSAVTARFALYYQLLLAMVFCLWIADWRYSPLTKLWVVGLAVFLQLPNPDASFWTHRLNVPKFFASGDYRRELRPGENVLAFPYGKGDPMLWQIYTDMYFAMPEGWTGPTPRSFEAWPIVTAFKKGVAIPDQGQQMRAFTVAHRIETVIIDPRFPKADFWSDFLQNQGARIESIDGVFIARLPSSGWCQQAAVNCGPPSHVD